ncbi:MAG: hemolysin III family protein [Gaiellales bacterium]
MTTANGIVAPLESEIPRLRGMIHVVACPLLIATGIVLATQADGWRGVSAVIVMASGYALVFGTSGLYHRWRWSPRVKRILKHLDHTMIFVGIAFVYTALWIAVLNGVVADIMLAYVWCGVVVGTLMKLKYLDARASRHSLAYIAFSLVGLAVLPGLAQHMGTTGVVLMLGGAVAFMLGAVAFASGRPNPFPRIAGHHEVFHATTVIGAGLHLAALASVVLRHH